MGLLTWAVGWALRSKGQELRALGPRSAASWAAQGPMKSCCAVRVGVVDGEGPSSAGTGPRGAPRGGRMAGALGQNVLLLEME